VTDDGLIIPRSRVFPLCQTCVREADGREGFWDDLLRRYKRSLIVTAVLDGGGTGDGQKRGTLRLVQPPEEDDAD
jgi:hypothetical protein